MRKRTLMLQHPAKITAIDPPAASRTPDEMLGFVLRFLLAKGATEIGASGNHRHSASFFALCGNGRGLSGIYATLKTQRGVTMDANSGEPWSEMDIADLTHSLAYGNTIADAA